jgi:hypothetical protein
VTTLEGMVPITKIQSLNVNNSFVHAKAEEPTAKTRLALKYPHLKWNQVCFVMYKCLLDTYSREFQYRIIHNYLTTNRNLYKWKLNETTKCSFCFAEDETISHLFCTCAVTFTFYLNICKWMETCNINLPDNKVESVVYGIVNIDDNWQIINHVINIYKQLVFKARSNTKLLTISCFIRKMLAIENIEKRIAVKNGNLTKHLTKWESIKEKLENTVYHVANA